jgi:hypothetical protein
VKEGRWWSMVGGSCKEGSALACTGLLPRTQGTLFLDSQSVFRCVDTGSLGKTHESVAHG